MWKSDEGKNVSYWQASEKSLRANSLSHNIDTAVCVIGGGIAGLTTAYLLTKAGVDAVVIDDGPIGGGETARTTAHLTWAIDDRLYRIAKWHGDEHAKLAVNSHIRAVDEIERIINAEKIDCDFSRLDGFLVQSAEPDDDLDAELEALQRLGFLQVENGSSVAGFADRQTLRFPAQGQFHILKYLAVLAEAITNNGGRIFAKTPATDWQDQNGLTVITAKGTITCSHAIVLATNYPLKSKMFPKLMPYRTYAIGARIPKGAMDRMLIWDNGDPYHYVRVQEDAKYDVLIVGGEDHRTGHANDGDERFDRLWTWTQQYFPFAEKIVNRWSGQCLETHDGLAFLGRYSSDHPNVFMITGDSGMGMTHCTIGAMLVSDLMRGRDNAWEKVYDPSRLATQSIKEALPELINSTIPYVDWVTGGDVASVATIEPGRGAILRDGIQKIAAYRDEKGNLYKHSAVCPHMGCIVRFNSSERTWDCPCHGSRFDAADGHAVNGPAMGPLVKFGQ